jgi:hypothetical protein
MTPDATHGPMPLTLGSVVVIAQDQLSSDLGGEAAILNLKSGTYYGLNPVGARIWTLIREPRMVQSVLNQLLVEFDVEPDRCERDLIALLGQLAEEGLVEIRNE